MRTMINGKDAPWTPEIQAKWDTAARGRPDGSVSSSNYFTPRPYQDEYSAGSKEEGFTYTLGNYAIGYRVFQVIINGA